MCLDLLKTMRHFYWLCPITPIKTKILSECISKAWQKPRDEEDEDTNSPTDISTSKVVAIDNDSADSAGR